MQKLIVFGGRPGVGKTTLARMLAAELRAAYVRIDTIEQALVRLGTATLGPEGYAVGYRIAAENLRLGLDVVADSVNPLEVTRAAWREVAAEAGAAVIELEIVCGDGAEHRRRVAGRAADIAGHRLPTWADVERGDYEPWERERLVIDTAGWAPEESLRAILAQIRLAKD